MRGAARMFVYWLCALSSSKVADERLRRNVCFVSQIAGEIRQVRRSQAEMKIKCIFFLNISITVQRDLCVRIASSLCRFCNPSLAVQLYLDLPSLMIIFSTLNRKTPTFAIHQRRAVGSHITTTTTTSTRATRSMHQTLLPYNKRDNEL